MLRTPTRRRSLVANLANRLTVLFALGTLRLLIFGSRRGTDLEVLIVTTTIGQQSAETSHQTRIDRVLRHALGKAFLLVVAEQTASAQRLTALGRRIFTEPDAKISGLFLFFVGREAGVERALPAVLVFNTRAQARTPTR